MIGRYFKTSNPQGRLQPGPLQPMSKDDQQFWAILAQRRKRGEPCNLPSHTVPSKQENACG